MPQAQGYAAYAGLGIQSTLGVNVTRTKFLDFISESIEIQPQRKQWNNAGESGFRINTELGLHSEGSLEVYANFEGLDSWLKQAFGSGSVTTTNPAGAAFNHTFALKDAVKSPGVSLEINRDVTAFLYEACQFDEVEFIQDPNDYLRVRFGIRGRDETQVTATSPSFATPLKVHSSQLTCKVATVVTTVNSYRISIRNNLTGFRPQLSTPITKEIIRGGKRSVSGEISLAFEDLVRYNEFRNLNNIALELKYVGAVITGSETFRFQLNMPQINWDGRTPNVPGPGPVDFSMPFTAFMTTRAANDELALVIENTATSVA